MILINKNSKICFQNSFSLYIHIPFCKKKCSYCDFYSETGNINKVNKKIKQYLKALKKEIDLYRPYIKNSNISTIFIGGGTPNILSGKSIKKILDIIINKFNVSSPDEISIETNPIFINNSDLKKYKKAGINRLSLGIQSLNNKQLSLLGRLHSSHKAIQAIKKVKKYFKNFNLDLIFAIPGQTLQNWQHTLFKILEFNPTHLSLYNLQIEKDTPIYKECKKGKIEPISEELDAEMYEKAIKILNNRNFIHYEVSNFARSGYECRHNLAYWKCKPYLGLGPAAHSFDGKNRFNNYSNLKKYMDSVAKGELPLQNFINLSRKDLISEKMIMGLRLLKGISKKEFYNEFGIKVEKIFSQKIDSLKKRGLIKESSDFIRLSYRGLMLGNKVFQEFLF